MHICISKLTIVGSDNGLSPGGGSDNGLSPDRRQAIIWISVGVLLIGPSGTNFSEIVIEIHTFLLRKMHLKMLSANGGRFVSAYMLKKKQHQKV